ncbi:MAG: C_GCAxxG_C_C family protein [Oscillospiraceae bacterium]|nr:C_GCAxxG_C_C family protein [Oscillospiraceae bacterium]
MTRKEDMAALRADTQVHYNCAQSVVVPFARDMGLTRELAYDLALNFGGGMGCGATCGALIGALAALGGLGQPQEKRLELIRTFRTANGAIDCAALLKAAHERGEEKKPHCDGLVRQCVDFVCRETGLE